MGVELDRSAGWVWVGADLPDDPDAWEFKALLACFVERSAALTPQPEGAEAVPEHVVEFGREFVDYWWDSIVGASAEFDSTWMYRAMEVADGFQRHLHPPLLQAIDFLFEFESRTVQSHWLHYYARFGSYCGFVS